MNKSMVKLLGKMCPLLTALTVILLTLALLGPQSAAGSLPASLQYPVVEVKPQQFAKSLPSLALAGARNEHLLLHCRFPGADFTSFKIKVIETGRQPQSAQINAAFYQLCWAPPETMGKVQPDALLPVERGLVHTGTSLDIVTVLSIPPNAAPGFYDYELTASDKNQRYTQPFKVRVYNFFLPDDLPVPIFGGFWNYKPERYQSYGVQSLSAYLETVKSYYGSMRHYKINMLGGAYFFSFQELHPNRQIEDFQEYHQLLDHALNQLKYRGFMIPKLRGWQTVNQPEDDYIARAKLFYPLYQAYLERHGWQDRALNYLIDEPRPDHYPAVQQAYAASKALAPAIKTLCAGWNPAPEFVQVIDLWATPAGHYKEAFAQTARSQGQKQWLYANRLHGIDHPHVHQRLIGWILHRHQFDGYLLWGLNYWPNDPWTTEPGAQDYLRRGTFYYPHPHNGQPVPTLRLESLRRGFQDYQYLHLLTEAHHQGKVPSAAFADVTQRVQVLTANFQTSDFPVPMQELESLRLQIGELLDKAGTSAIPAQSKKSTPAPTQPSSRNRLLQDLLRFFYPN